MNYSNGIFHCLLQLERGEDMLELAHIAKLLQANIADEGLYGTNESIRHERAMLVADLDTFVRACLGVSFIDLCAKPRPLW
jgi:hypothetical protein